MKTTDPPFVTLVSLLLGSQLVFIRGAKAQADVRAAEPAETQEPAPAPAPEPSAAEVRAAEAEVVAEGVAEEGVEEQEPTFEGVAEVEVPPREATRRTLEQEQLTTIAGTRGDAFRAVEVMPGVGRTQFGTNPGPPLLRGSPSSESTVFVDGGQLPLLYHFGGLTSFFNSHLLESVTLYPGNYSARYGRAAGGTIEAKVRDPKSDAPRLMLELSAIDSFVLAEGPLGERTSIAVAGRRSNVDLFIDALISDDSTAVVAAPVYWDYQAILAHRINDAHQLRVVLYGGGDALELHFGEAVAEDPALAGEFGSSISAHRAQFELQSHLSEVVEQQLMVSAGRAPGTGQLGEVRYDYASWEANARAEWSFLLAPWLRLDTGLDVQALAVEFLYEGPTPAPDEGVPAQGTLASDSGILVDSKINALRPAVYLEASLRPTADLLLVPGVRVDHSSDAGGATTVDPRLTSRLSAGASTTFKAGAGYYSQPPQYWEVFPGFGNPKAKPFRTLQTSAGVEQALGERVRIDVDGFYKHWQDRIIGTEGGAPPGYVNGGTGDAYGLELLLDVSATDECQAYLAYTLSRSTRKDGTGAERRLFDDDQTHNLSLLLSRDLGRGWRAGARFRYVTGNPYSEVRGAAYDASTDTYRPLYSGVNDARNPAFHQLDVRVDKLWELGPIDLTAYLEVMNIYNRQNQEGRRYSFDYQQSSSVIGMPLFPNVGLRGEL
jgi:TonB dependent receptor/TonB-dependent Receptor Plug Domain